MGQQLILNGEPGISVRNALNQMFAELYATIDNSIQIENASGNHEVLVLPNTFIVSIAFYPLTGSPTVAIGTTPGGQDILSTIPISQFQFILAQQYFFSEVNLYITLLAGTVNIRLDFIPNYF